MSLTASPFNPSTGELLPVYRDAYLRGDLSAAHTQAVDAHLKKNATLGTQTWQRFHEMAQTGEQVQAVGWMQRQMNLARTAPQRTRRQVTALAAVAVLIGGAVFAAGTTPSTTPTAPIANAPAETASTLRMATVRGRILNENGQPLIGATVLEKNSHRGVSTDANGEYTLTVPAGRATTLAYGYGGYVGEEVSISGNAKAMSAVTLVPNYEAPAKRVSKLRHWFSSI